MPAYDNVSMISENNFFLIDNRYRVRYGERSPGGFAFWYPDCTNLCDKAVSFIFLKVLHLCIGKLFEKCFVFFQNVGIKFTIVSHNELLFLSTS